MPGRPPGAGRAGGAARGRRREGPEGERVFAPVPDLPPDLPRTRLVAGLQPVREAIRRHGARLDRVALEARDSARLGALERFAKDNGVADVRRYDGRLLERLCGTVAHQGAVAWAPELVLLDPDELLARPSGVVVALDGIQDPQNFGAVVRSAVAMARAPVLWPESSSAPLSLATFRASAGAIEHAELCRVRSLTTWLTAFADAGGTVVGLDAGAPSPIAAVPASERVALVIGSEHEGLGRGVRRSCTALARLMDERPIDSLNASVAAAVALYAVVQARRAAGFGG